MTAAHCANDDDYFTANSVRINPHFGSTTNTDNDGWNIEDEEESARHNHTSEILSIWKEIPHPLYQSAAWHSHDVMIVKLRRKSKVPIRVKLANSSMSMAENGTRLTIMGWGSEDPSGFSPVASVLQVTTMQSISNEDCINRTMRPEAIQAYKDYANQTRLEIANDDTWTYEGRVTNDQMCAVADDTSVANMIERGTCYGDSGGPVIIPGTDGEPDLQVGIVSWGFMCASSHHPDVYARVNHHYDWIRYQVCYHSSDPPEHFRCGEEERITISPSPTQAPEVTSAPSESPAPSAERQEVITIIIGASRSSISAWTLVDQSGRIIKEDGNDKVTTGSSFQYREKFPLDYGYNYTLTLNDWYASESFWHVDVYLGVKEDNSRILVYADYRDLGTFHEKEFSFTFSEDHIIQVFPTSAPTALSVSPAPSGIQVDVTLMVKPNSPFNYGFGIQIEDVSDTGDGFVAYEAPIGTFGEMNQDNVEYIPLTLDQNLRYNLTILGSYSLHGGVYVLYGYNVTEYDESLELIHIHSSDYYGYFDDFSKSFYVPTEAHFEAGGALPNKRAYDDLLIVNVEIESSPPRVTNNETAIADDASLFRWSVGVGDQLIEIASGSEREKHFSGPHDTDHFCLSVYSTAVDDERQQSQQQSISYKVKVNGLVVASGVDVPISVGGVIHHFFQPKLSNTDDGELLPITIFQGDSGPALEQTILTTHNLLHQGDVNRCFLILPRGGTNEEPTTGVLVAATISVNEGDLYQMSVEQVRSDSDGPPLPKLFVGVSYSDEAQQELSAVRRGTDHGDLFVFLAKRRTHLSATSLPQRDRSRSINLDFTDLSPRATLGWAVLVGQAVESPLAVGKQHQATVVEDYEVFDFQIGQLSDIPVPLVVSTTTYRPIRILVFDSSANRFSAKNMKLVLESYQEVGNLVSINEGYSVVFDFGLVGHADDIQLHDINGGSGYTIDKQSVASGVFRVQSHTFFALLISSVLMLSMGGR